MRQIGFTLPEVIITVVVIAILVGIGIPVYNGIIDNQRLKSAIAQLDSDFRNAQTKAKATSVEYKIEFTLSNTYYDISNIKTGEKTPRPLDGGVSIGNTGSISFWPATNLSETSSGTVRLVTSSGRKASIAIDSNGLITTQYE